MVARKAKDLCMFCRDRYFMGHNCKGSKLYVLELESEGLGEKMVVSIEEEGKDKGGNQTKEFRMKMMKRFTCPWVEYHSLNKGHPQFIEYQTLSTLKF